MVFGGTLWLFAYVFKEGGDLFIFIDCGEDDTEKETQEWNSVIWVPTILWYMLGICIWRKRGDNEIKSKVWKPPG